MRRNPIPTADPDTSTRIGGWLFRHRTLAARADRPRPAAHPPRRGARLADAAGRPASAIVAAGEALRLWARASHRRHLADAQRSARTARGERAVRAACAIRSTSATSRSGSASRSARGCCGWRRSSSLLLGARVPRDRPMGGTAARGAAAATRIARTPARVPRWLPVVRRDAGAGAGSTATFSWRETLFSERGTLIAIAVGLPAALAQEHGC